VCAAIAGCRAPAPRHSPAPSPPSQAVDSRGVPLDELAVLEAPDREEWQQPERIMDALGIADGARVADVGAGSGWFTVRLAHRVGPNGRVYAVDIDPAWIAYLSRRIQREGLTNVETITGTRDDPNLPAGLDAALLVNTFWQLQDPVPVLRQIAASLAPQGRLGIVDFRDDGGGGPGPPRELRSSVDAVTRAAESAGLRVVGRVDALRYQFLVILERRPPASTPAAGAPPQPRS
jgi:ubiquinone/menaquinone biosynthesis C-methylase UbiE